MFIIGKAFEESKYLHHLSYKLFKQRDLFFVIFLLVLLSALLMNDTIANNKNTNDVIISKEA